MELTGYKKSPELEAFKTTMASRDSSRYKLQKFLDYMSSQGFDTLGSGTFGAVFKHHSLNYCIKMFKNDAPYLKFIKICGEFKRNPHLPKFRGKFMKIDDEHYAVRMEVLEPVDNSWNDRIKVIDYSTDTDFKADFKCFEEEFSKETLDYFIENPSILATWKMLVANCGNFYPDMHKGNVMLRDDTLVFIDPYWSGVQEF